MDRVGTGTHALMDLRRTTWGAAIELAITLSVVAATIAVILHSMGVLSQPVIVLGVIAVGFATSWVRTGRIAREAAHRAVTVPIRGVHFPVS